MNVTCDIPYPSLKINKPDEKHTETIEQIICICNNKMTTIATYLYQHWILYPQYADISNLLFRISKVEMYHLDISGKLIILLGGDPELTADAHTNTDKDKHNIRQILEENIQNEMVSARFYQRQAALVKDEYVSNMLNRLAMDDILHAKLFTSYYDRLPLIQ